MTQARENAGSVGYQLFMVVLCLYALGALAVETAVNLQPTTRTIIGYADYAVCFVFLVDFVMSLARAENRWRYFVTWGWLDLVSSIPTIAVVRWGRAARVVRVFRVLRGLRAARTATTLVMQRRAENTMFAASLIALFMVITCSVAVLHFEVAPDSNIRTAEDAIWWAFVSITTVGYGDHYPVTPAGRMFAALLMTAGVGLFGTFSAFLAAWFIGPAQTGPSTAELTDEISALRAELAAMRETMARGRTV